MKITAGYCVLRCSNKYKTLPYFLGYQEASPFHLPPLFPRPPHLPHYLPLHPSFSRQKVYFCANSNSWMSSLKTFWSLQCFLLVCLCWRFFRFLFLLLRHLFSPHHLFSLCCRRQFFLRKLFLRPPLLSCCLLRQWWPFLPLFPRPPIKIYKLVLIVFTNLWIG